MPDVQAYLLLDPQPLQQDAQLRGLIMPDAYFLRAAKGNQDASQPDVSPFSMQKPASEKTFDQLDAMALALPSANGLKGRPAEIGEQIARADQPTPRRQRAHVRYRPTIQQRINGASALRPARVELPVAPI